MSLRFLINFYRVIIEECVALVNYHAWKSRATNLIVLVQIY